MSKRKKVKGKKKKLNNERISSWFLKAFSVAFIGYVLYAGVPAFVENSCGKCVLPTLGLGGLVSAVILAILNEVKNYIGK